MGYEKPDPYNQPEAFGLVPVATVDWLGDDACYEFCYTEIWYKPEEKNFYWASDSGCSCNAPFEQFDENDLESGGIFVLMNMLTEGLGDNPRPEVSADVADAIEAALRHRNGKA